MLSGVLGVKESISDDIMSIRYHLGHYSEQEAQLDPYCSLKNRNFHKNKMTGWSVTDISATFLPVPMSYIIVTCFVAI